ncbi:hypothetical protein Tco_0927473 [Tanacetum coccineum]
MPEGYNFPRGNCIHCVGVGTNVEEGFDLADLLNVVAKTLGNRKFGSSYKAGLIVPNSPLEILKDINNPLGVLMETQNMLALELDFALNATTRIMTWISEIGGTLATFDPAKNKKVVIQDPVDDAVE